MHKEKHAAQENEQQQTAQNREGGEQVHISQPHTERAEGQFEHSGETSGWTKEEREEKEQQDDRQQA